MNLLKDIFNIYKNNFITIFVITLVYAVINVFFMSKLSPYMAKTDITSAFGSSFSQVGIIIIAQEVLRVIFLVGFLSLILKAIKKEPISFKVFFNSFSKKRFFQILKLEIFVLIIAIGGMMLLIIPGLIWFTLAIFSYFIICSNPNIKVLDSINYSINLSKGYRFKIFFILIIYGIFSLLGTIGTFYALIFDLVLVPSFYISIAYLLKDSINNQFDKLKYKEIDI